MILPATSELKMMKTRNVSRLHPFIPFNFIFVSDVNLSKTGKAIGNKLASSLIGKWIFKLPPHALFGDRITLAAQKITNS